MGDKIRKALYNADGTLNRGAAASCSADCRDFWAGFDRTDVCGAGLCKYSADNLDSSWRHVGSERWRIF